MPSKSETPYERLLRPSEAADKLRLSNSWLAKARLRGDGPRFLKIGRVVRYLEVDVAAFLEGKSRTSTSVARHEARLRALDASMGGRT